MTDVILFVFPVIHYSIVKGFIQFSSRKNDEKWMKTLTYGKDSSSLSWKAKEGVCPSQSGCSNSNCHLYIN